MDVAERQERQHKDGKLSARERIGVKNGEWGLLGTLGRHENILAITCLLTAI